MPDQTPTTGKVVAQPQVAPEIEQEKTRLAVAALETSTSVMNPIEHEQLRRLSKEYHASGAFPESYKNHEQIMMAMIMGRSMGMTPHESVVNGYFIRGVYNVYGKAVPAALRRHGWFWKFTNENPESCTVELVNKTTGEEIVDTFTYDDAEESGFTTDNYGKVKIGWKAGANRKRKLRYGVLSQVLHTYIPEVLGSAGGIAEYSEDYNEATPSAEDAAETRRLRMEAAAAERAQMANDGFQPTIVEPFHEEDSASEDTVTEGEIVDSEPLADSDQQETKSDPDPIEEPEAPSNVDAETGEILDAEVPGEEATEASQNSFPCDYPGCKRTQTTKWAEQSRKTWGGVVACGHHWSQLKNQEVALIDFNDPNFVDPAEVPVE